ncbi:hypothetical protein SpiGrapes_2208 [Sphaerochaeta pleomorpha str. Grapes]|uniref:Uncharacterized protein n=1 Tax=Sphaerochaeta pleomorpha (strain ATCC BAA-1885 / DSM 22778 / Grapes) TaxID=158190 RepID=G8QRY6_SPHPG|nr:hypothetical protein [Sphaerochaeta pleomorpha]AEV29984.1 hypothetical protein SpiGrapes_2208 [Sphaerochaeta pleomorpha str. Grapes]
MLLDVTTVEPIEALSWHSLPDIQDGVMKDEIWKCGDLVCSLLDNPRCKSGEDLVSIPYAMSVKRGKDLVLVISLEQDDLRALSLKLGCSLKELQEDYQTKSNFGPLHGFVYSQEREDLGVYDYPMDLQSLRVFFLDTICDTFDIVEPPVQIKL